MCYVKTIKDQQNDKSMFLNARTTPYSSIGYTILSYLQIKSLRMETLFKIARILEVDPKDLIDTKNYKTE